MLINLNETQKKLDDIRSGKIKEGLKLNIPSIDEFIRFKHSNFNVILGQRERWQNYCYIIFNASLYETL